MSTGFSPRSQLSIGKTCTCLYASVKGRGNVSHLKNVVYTLVPTTGRRLRATEKRDSMTENRKGAGVDSARGDELVSREYRNTNNGSATQTPGVSKARSKPSPSNVPLLKCCLTGEPEGHSEKTA